MKNVEYNSFLLERNLFRSTVLVSFFLVGICIVAVMAIKKSEKATLLSSVSSVNQLHNGQRIIVNDSVLLFSLESERYEKTDKQGDYCVLGIINEHDKTVSDIIIVKTNKIESMEYTTQQIKIGDTWHDAKYISTPVEGFLKKCNASSESELVWTNTRYYLYEMGYSEEQLDIRLSKYYLNEVLVGDKIEERINSYVYLLVLFILFEAIMIPIWISVLKRWRMVHS